MGDLETKRLQFSSVETVSLRWNNLPSYLICKVRNFTLYCHEESFFFWVLVAAFTVAEPILCSRKPLGLIYLLQVVVLGVSTLLYFIQLTGEAVSQWNRILDIDSNSMFESFHLEEAKKNILNESILIKAMIFFSSEGVYLLELMLLTLGWSLIFIKPGIAALRCFRVFRLLW